MAAGPLDALRSEPLHGAAGATPSQAADWARIPAGYTVRAAGLRHSRRCKAGAAAEDRIGDRDRVDLVTTLGYPIT